MIDINLPEVSKDANGDPVITLTATQDGNPFITNVTTYHNMSDEHLATMGQVVDAFFAAHKHTGLSYGEFAHWEDQAMAALKGFRDNRQAAKIHGHNKP